MQWCVELTFQWGWLHTFYHHHKTDALLFLNILLRQSETCVAANICYVCKVYCVSVMIILIFIVPQLIAAKSLLSIKYRDDGVYFGNYASRILRKSRRRKNRRSRRQNRTLGVGANILFFYYLLSHASDPLRVLQSSFCFSTFDLSRYLICLRLILVAFPILPCLNSTISYRISTAADLLHIYFSRRKCMAANRCICCTVCATTLAL